MGCTIHNSLVADRPTMVSVNGVAIPRASIAREVQHHPAGKPIAAWQAAARALVIRELLLQEARRLGLRPEPVSDSEGRRETDEEALIRALIEREVTTPVADEETCRRYYERNQSRFRSADLYEAAHILFPARKDDPAGYEAARQQAGSVLAMLQQEPHRFAEMAADFSACPSAAQGGNLGQVSAEQTAPEFERALAAMTPGSLCPEPVESRSGFHIIRLERRIEGRMVPFEAVAEQIADYLARSVMRRASAQYIARLAAAADIRGVEMAAPESLRVH